MAILEVAFGKGTSKYIDNRNIYDLIREDDLC